jgi:hypothetical protein
MNFAIERESPGCVRHQQWRFWTAISHRGTVQVVLDEYTESTRPSLRHKYRPLWRYSRVDCRESTIPLAEVPRPADVYNEAFQHVADNIEVVVWPGDITSAEPFEDKL